ncbi:MAG: hypothetical protein LT105_14335 [Lentimicrobium sp.]|nr:hypothetical protein [Lentimicrobium sp.]
MKNNLFLLLAGILLFTSCAKDLDLPDTETDVPVSIDELNVSDSFSWNTAATVKLKIQGLPTIIPIRSSLKISLPDGSVVFNRMHLMSENLTINLTIPSNFNTLILSFGDLKEELKVNNGEANFSFIPLDTEE